MEKSLLILSYLFPPRGGAGVQRALKFVKYLPDFGWRPLVIANGTSCEDRVTKSRDPILLDDLPPETVIRYTDLTPAEARSFDGMQRRWRQRLQPTDPMAWWVRPAIRAAMKLVEQHAPSAILVTMSPFTAAEAGIRLKALTGLPLILDLRDPWALDETRIYPTRWHAQRDWRAMADALAAADLIIMNTPEAARAVQRAFDVRPRTRIISITNGFDADDFAPSRAQDPVPPPAQDTLRIVHTGMFHSELAAVWDTLHQRQGWLSRLKYSRRPINLWTRTPRYLLQALGMMVERGRMAADKLELVLVGELSASDRALIDASPLRSSVRMLGYQSHARSVQWLQSADLLFLPLHTPLDGGPATIIPGKTFEYLGSGRPILAMGPPGDMRCLIQETRSGATLDGDDAEGAAKAMDALYQAKGTAGSAARAFRDRAGSSGGPHPLVACFERRALAGCLAEELDGLLRAASGQLSAVTRLHQTTDSGHPTTGNEVAMSQHPELSTQD